ncbi:MAG TPA: adenosylcobinamide-GDP ribazoletransferase [Roseococcus sp.]|nr:adenosylcobinamide-GDP ribazoletransferase [Roseococcus sp.]
MREQWAILLLAVQFLTRLPVPASAHFTPGRLRAATRFYPLVGALVGGLGALAFLAADALWPPVIAALLSLAATLPLTGAFYEDGLADTFDGIGGGLTRERALEIMRDSRIGTYGTAALLLAFGLKLGALAALPALAVAAALPAAHGLSRFSAVVVIATSRYARDDGTGKPTADGIAPASLAIAGGTAALLLAGLALATGVPAALGAAAGLVLGHLAMRRVFERKLGGYTGDCLGAVQQASEVGAWLGLLACL